MRYVSICEDKQTQFCPLKQNVARENIENMT